MPQAVPLIGRAAAKADELDEAFDVFASDGVLTPGEMVTLGRLVDETKATTTHADLAYQWGMAVLKGGIDGKRAKEIENEITRFEDQCA